jgi:hypothetical protein
MKTKQKRIERKQIDKTKLKKKREIRRKTCTSTHPTGEEARRQLGQEPENKTRKIKKKKRNNHHFL